MLVRTGGLATTVDKYVRLETRWRVRTAPHESDDADAGVLPDGGRLLASALDSGPEPDAGRAASAIADRAGDAGPHIGAPLERYCSEVELDPAATTRERIDCLRDDRTLRDVPAGVPPIALEVIPLHPGSVPDFLALPPGRKSQVLSSSVTAGGAGGPTTAALAVANYFIHAVGVPVLPRDTDGDRRLTMDEMRAPPPDFSAPPSGTVPTHAILLKDVYNARLVPETGRPIRKIPSFDRHKEHAFSVIEIATGAQAPQVIAHGETSERELEQNDQLAQAELGDSSYELLLTLLEPPAPSTGAIDRPGDYSVRFGTDEQGIECDITVTAAGTQTAIESTCDGVAIEDIIGASDVLYIELFLSGNSDNVLYRYNMYGTRPRRDLISVGSMWTADKSVEELASNADLTTRSPKTSVGEPAIAYWFIDPSDMERGKVTLCSTDTCTHDDDPLKVLDVTGYTATDGFLFTETGGTVSTERVEKIEGESGAAEWFLLPLPPDVSGMPGHEDSGRSLHVIYEPADRPDPTPWMLNFKRPKGRSESAGVEQTGHVVIAGIDIADGHLSRAYPDIVLPEKSTTRSFVRYYNNQRNEPSALGTGWNHNLEAWIVEEVPGRYQVFVDGQARDFPFCSVSPGGAPRTSITSISNCETDKVHGGLLTFPIATSPDGLEYDAFRAEYETEDGVVYVFERESSFRDRGRRRFLVTEVDDGLANPLVWTYKGDTDLVERVERSGGLRFELFYDDQGLTDPDVASLLAVAFRRGQVERLARVDATLGSGALVARMTFDHDLSNGSACGLSALPSSGDFKRGLLFAACRETRATSGGIAQDLLSKYTYAQPRGEQYRKWATGNELGSERLDIAGGASSLVFEASYTRRPDAAAAPYAHLDVGEVIETAVILGDTFELGGGDTSRSMVTPTGTITATVNPYGNATDLSTPCGPTSADWDSDADTGAVVSPTSSGIDGTQQTCGYDERNRSKGRLATNTATGSLKPLAKPLVNVGPSNVTLDGDTGTATSMDIPAAGAVAGTVGMTRTVNADGFVIGESITGGPSWSQPVDADGLPAGSGTDVEGNTIDMLGFASQEFGQPTTIRAACSTCVSSVSTPDGLATANVLTGVELTIEYDALGRAKRTSNATTGRASTVTYDAIGRIVATTDEESASSTSVTYARSGPQLTVVETRVSPLGTSVTTTTSRRGLVRFVEKTADGASAETTTFTYDTPKECALRGVLREVAGTAESTEIVYTARHQYERVTVRRNNQVLMTTYYDGLGNPARIETPDGVADEENRYDLYGRIERNIKGKNLDHAFVFEYSAAGDLQRTRSDTSVAATVVGQRDADLQIDSRDPTTRRVTAWSRPSQGYSEALTYDALGRVVKRVRAVTTRGQSGTDIPLFLTELHEFDDAARTEKHTTVVGSPVSAPRVSSVTRNYDALSRLTSVVDQDATVSFTYTENAAGQRTAVERIGPGTERELTEYLDDGTVRVSLRRRPGDTPIVTEQRYDGRGKLVEQQNLSSTISYTYDGSFLAGFVSLSANEDVRAEYTRSDQGRALVEDVTRRQTATGALLERTRTTRTYTGQSLHWRKAVLDAGGVELFAQTGTAILDSNEVQTTSVTNFGDPPVAVLRETLADAAGFVVHQSAPQTVAVRSWDLSECGPGATTCKAIEEHADGSVTVHAYDSFSGSFEPSVMHIPAAFATIPSSGRCYFDDGTTTGAFLADTAIGMAKAGNTLDILDLVVASIDLQTGLFRCDLRNIYDAAVAQDDNLDRQIGHAREAADTILLAAGVADIGVRVTMAGVRRAAALTSRAVGSSGRVASRAGPQNLDVLNKTPIGEACRPPNCPCFTGDTLVQTDDGPVPIADIVVGDVVVSRDEATGETTLERVVRTFITHDKQVLELELHDDETATSEIVVATPDHPFWTERRGWTGTQHLAAGDRVLSAFGGWLRVGTSTWRQETATVYNLEVERSHTYFVGESGAWVHNSCATQAAWAGDLDAVNSTIARLGRRALRESGNDWRRAEEIFRGYLAGANRRFVRVGSTRRVAWQPAASVQTGQRVPAFVTRGGRTFAYPGSKRLDAGVIDLADQQRRLLSGFDISLDPTKQFTLSEYRQAFGDIPIFDIRWP